VLAGVGVRLQEGLPARARASRRTNWDTIAFLGFVYLAMIVVLAIGAVAGLRNPFVMAGQDWKIPALHVVAGIATAPLLVLLKRIQLAAVDDSHWRIAGRDVERMRLLRSSMQTATALLGVVIALAVIATGALRQATVAAGLTPLPESFVLVYGGWLTGVVAAVYLHVFGALEARGRWMLSTAAPLPDPDPDRSGAFAERRTLRTDLAAELELGGDARTNLEGLIAVLAPLAGALLTRLGGL
jgi:hypothetical protein